MKMTQEWGAAELQTLAQHQKVLVELDQMLRRIGIERGAPASSQSRHRRRSSACRFKSAESRESILPCESRVRAPEIMFW